MTVPSVTEPSRKVTDPASVPPVRVRTLTVAVNFTGLPRFPGRGLAASLVVVGTREGDRLDGLARPVPRCSPENRASPE